MEFIIAGDFAPQGRLKEQINDRKFVNIFSDRLINIIKSTDFSIVNLECPIADDNFKPILKCGPNLKCTSNAVDALQYAGFAVVTMANNHILDYGEDGLNLTLEYCKKAGLQTVGVGSNLREAQKTLYISKVGTTLAVINCCEHEFSIATENSAGANPLNPIKQFYSIQEAKKKADYVLVIVHGGHEYHQLPSPRMQETYRFFIDAGADAVVNHHQHCFSGYEIYKDRPIFYGLGNFCFDGNYRNSVWNEGYMAILDFTESGVSIDTVPYIQCNEKPGVFPIEDRFSFDKRLSELNNIIADPKRLLEETRKYYKSQEDFIGLLFEPYSNRYMRKLRSLKLIPSLISTKKWLSLLNIIDCESHRDKTLFMLRNKCLK